MEGVFNASNQSSLIKLESLLSQLSFLPDTNNLKSSLLSYCVPYHPEWNEGIDISICSSTLFSFCSSYLSLSLSLSLPLSVGDSVLVVAPALNVDSNGHFWLQEPSTPAVLGHLALISQTLT